MVLKIISSATAATAIVQLLRHGDSYLNFLTNCYQIATSFSPSLAVPGLMITLIPILKLPASIGLFMSKRWGWLSTVVLLTLDYIFGLRVAIRMSISALDRTSSRMSFETYQNVKVVTISMWPTYIIAIISLVSVLILAQKSIRSLFNQKKNTA
jgi:hypothetical protein